MVASSCSYATLLFIPLRLASLAGRTWGEEKNEEERKSRKKKRQENTKKGKGKKEIRGKEKMDYLTF
jgi:hypothetical protein